LIYILACLIAVFGSLFILWIVGAVLYLRLRDEVLFRRLKSRRRVLDWDAVEVHLNAGTGTLIIEHTNKMGVRFWWTSDDLIAAGPPPIRDWTELGHGYITGKSSNPFVLWCSVNYLSAKDGKAFLSRLKNMRLPPGPATSAFFQDRYPKARIVHTLLR
jgi:hypothetical protein